MIITLHHANKYVYRLDTNILPRIGEWILIDGHRAMVVSIEYSYCDAESESNHRHLLQVITITTG